MTDAVHSGDSAGGEGARAAIGEQARKLAGAGQDLARDAASYSTDLAEAGRQGVVRRFDGVIASLRAAADELAGPNDGLAQAAEAAASRLEAIAAHIDDQNIDQLTEEACGFARRHPAMFLGGAVAIGFALGRTIRAGGASVAEAEDAASAEGEM